MASEMSALLRSEELLLLTSLKSDFTPDDTDLLGPLLEIIRIYLELINICEALCKYKTSVSVRRSFAMCTLKTACFLLRGDCSVVIGSAILLLLHICIDLYVE